MTQRRAQRGTMRALPPKPGLRFMRPPHSITLTLGLETWRTMRVIVTVEERGGPRFTHTETVPLDLEGRIPADLHAKIWQAVADFIQSEWTERVSRTF